MTSASAPRPDMGAYDSPVILKSSPLWARLVVWAIVGVTTASILWACLAKIEEAIPAQGKLEPRGAVQPVQAPVGGVIDTVEVQEGETVEAGQVLITLNPSDTESQLQSRQDVQSRLISENQYYRAQLSGEGGQCRSPCPLRCPA
ncbi:MAG: biotin/lipoyl-binding protein [Leptolyngbya sp. RL_3_1]|nr:biotin/lipoyl-binding protein [Leptolyngbya sp. RL_3_1]